VSRYTRLVYLAQLAQGVVDREQGLRWFRAQNIQTRQEIVHEVLDFTLASGPLDEPARAALKAAGAYRKARPRRSGCAWTAQPNASFGHLLEVMASRRCPGACPHWWHRDLGRPDVLEELQRELGGAPLEDLGAHQVFVDVLDDIISSFSEQFSFVRELVHNSVDAGASRVEFSWEEREHGVFILTVRDDGEGMTQTDINERLTRINESARAGDPQMFGQYGQGFLSVYALQPKAVVLDTGREGESWRVFFKQDRTFDRIALDTPTVGTSIQWIGQGEDGYREAFQSKARATLARYCRFARIPILWDGVRINEDFGLDEAAAVVGELASGGRLAMTPAATPFSAFYKHGILLVELGEVIPGLAFRLDKSDLQLTLTRDNVQQDKAYEEGLRWVRTLAAERLA